MSGYGSGYYRGRGSNYILGYGPLKSRIFWAGRIRTLAAYVKSGRVLDVGCAFGYFLKNLPSGYEPYGMDSSPYAISEAARTLPQGRATLADITDKIPLDGLFDAVTAFDVLEHVTDLGKALRNIYGKLKPRGILIIEAPTAAPIIDLDRSHTYRSLDEYVDSLTSSGFALKRIRGYYTIGSRAVMVPCGRGFNYVEIVAEKQGG